MESLDASVKTVSLHRRLIGGAQRMGALLLDQLYPPVCLNCDAPTASADTLCGACFAGLRPITAPLCRRLGLPFETDPGPDALSVEAIAEPPPFARARAAVLYNDVARTIVSRLKYGDRPELARALAQATGLECDPALARRIRRTRQQVGLSGDGRARNLAGAFAAHPDLLARLKGRHVVVVDDVYTTGATCKAVTRALLKGGAGSVDVISFARVVIGAEMPI